MIIIDDGTDRDEHQEKVRETFRQIHPSALEYYEKIVASPGQINPVATLALAAWRITQLEGMVDNLVQDLVFTQKRIQELEGKRKLITPGYRNLIKRRQ